MNKLHPLAMIAGLGLLLGVSATAWAQTPVCMPPGCNPTTSGDAFNTAGGTHALISNAKGADDTAFGDDALSSNTDGTFNTALGDGALYSNSTGDGNIAGGVGALGYNTTGEDNTALGAFALGNNGCYSGGPIPGVCATTGSGNIAVGFNAGSSIITGNDNIDIGNEGGISSEDDTIRLGTVGTQTLTYIAGVFDTKYRIRKGCEVLVQSEGLLGCPKSSARYKRDIRNMGDASDRLMKLRPVTFRYKADSSATEEYGLIAEEVAKVYPELVIDNSDGKPETVEYQVLPAMLLNEVQKQSREIAAMQRQIVALRKQNDEIAALGQRLDVLDRQARASRPESLASAPR